MAFTARAVDHWVGERKRATVSSGQFAVIGWQFLLQRFLQTALTE
jgi:hypothetical protein